MVAKHSHNHGGVLMRTTSSMHERGLLMGARQTRGRWRNSKSKRKRQTRQKDSQTSTPSIVNGHEAAESEQIDKLLLSSLRYWEVTRDLIDERMAALRR